MINIRIFSKSCTLIYICRKLENDRPTYTNLNRLQAQVVSNITTSMRFESAINLKLEEIQTNLIPYPRLHFPLMSYAPIIPSLKAAYSNISVKQITSESFDSANHVNTYTQLIYIYQNAPKISSLQKLYILSKLNIKLRRKCRYMKHFIKHIRHSPMRIK